MKKDVSINDELKAIQSGEMPCHSRKTGYLYRLLQAASGDAPQVNGKPDCTGCLQGTVSDQHPEVYRFPYLGRSAEDAGQCRLIR